MQMEDTFLEVLEQVRRRFRMYIWGYVVMPEHVHLLVSEPAEATLAAMMQTLKQSTAVQARIQGKRRAGAEPFWQARYFDHNVRNYAGFLTQLRYIHRNPVKRGLCAKPEQYPHHLRSCVIPTVRVFSSADGGICSCFSPTPLFSTFVFRSVIPGGNPLLPLLFLTPLTPLL
jgi:REP element-mobilizing transposase RayT